MKRRMLLAAGVALFVGGVAACEKKYEFDPPDREERVASADSLYSPALFDTVAWESTTARSRLGNEVYAAECRNCHGPLGSGDTEYARTRGVDVPSLVAPGWRFAESMDSVRHRIFVGHSAGMPTWGVAGISPREIDGVAYYLLEVLRPEVLGGG